MRAVLNMLGFISGGGLSVGMNVLASLEAVAPDDDFLVLLPNVAAYDKVAMPNNVAKHVIDVSSTNNLRRVWIDQITIPKLCRRFGADVLFSMSNFGPYRAPCAHVLGIHLGYLAYPVWPVWQRLSKRERAFLRIRGLYLSVVIARIDRVCMLTRTSAARMAEVFCLAPARITVIPNATPRSSYLRTPDAPHIRERMTSHPARVRLCYPAIGFPHKNHEILPETFRLLRDKYGIDDVAIFVTVEPGDSRNARKFLSAIDALGWKRQIVNLGHLDQSEVATVFRYSHGLLMPTLLELFSLPYLEAMQFGVPILTSDYDFAREVCGDAASYFDPLDPNAIAGAIARFSRRPEATSDMRQPVDAKTRQDRLTWDDVTARYITVLREACGHLKGPRGSCRRDLERPEDRVTCKLRGPGF